MYFRGIVEPIRYVGAPSRLTSSLIATLTHAKAIDPTCNLYSLHPTTVLVTDCYHRQSSSLRPSNVVSLRRSSDQPSATSQYLLHPISNLVPIATLRRSTPIFHHAPQAEASVLPKAARLAPRAGPARSSPTQNVHLTPRRTHPPWSRAWVPQSTYCGTISTSAVGSTSLACQKSPQASL